LPTFPAQRRHQQAIWYTKRKEKIMGEMVTLHNPKITEFGRTNNWNAYFPHFKKKALVTVPFCQHLR
jgi:hypothetical protein